MIKEIKTNFTEHALTRLTERTSMPPEDLCFLLDNNKIVPLGNEAKYNRSSKLFFSKNDDKFFVAVQDSNNGYVVTILTIEYWYNLSKKFFLYKNKINNNDLLMSIMLADPNNPIIKHQPIGDSKTLRFSISTINDDGYRNSAEVGKIDVNIIRTMDAKKISTIIKDEVESKLKAKNINEKNIIEIAWYFKRKELKRNNNKVSHKIDYIALVEDIKNDFYKRIELYEKYDAFLELLKQNKNSNNDYDKFF